jgi:hypothetical protein
MKLSDSFWNGITTGVLISCSVFLIAFIIKYKPKPENEITQNWLPSSQSNHYNLTLPSNIEIGLQNDGIVIWRWKNK